MSIKPTKEQITAFLAAPTSGPIHMVNLLKFKAKTSSDTSGQASYNKYGENVLKMVQERGGKIVWHGKPMGVLIGDNDADAWDYIVIIPYTAIRQCRLRLKLTGASRAPNAHAKQ
ncbi:MAG: hypothetical protein NTW88_00045 [Actinobacteria bacterium]|nr:hypothetical protein [Actinomycetota bacterium]